MHTHPDHRRALTTPGLPQFKYMAVLAKINLADKYQLALDDPDYMSMRHEMALTETRLMQLLDSLSSEAPSTHWRKMIVAFAQFKKAQKEGNEAVIAQTYTQMDEILESGYGDEKAWNGILEAMEIKRRLVETEAKSMERLNQTMTVDQAMAFLGTVVSIIRLHVNDPVALANISRDLQRMTGPGVRNFVDLTDAQDALDVTG